MRGLLLTLLTGVIAGQVLSAYSTSRFNRHNGVEDRIDALLADSFAASDTPSFNPRGLRRTR